MASDLSTCLRQLKTCLDTQQIPQARSVIDRITQLTIDKADESPTETDFKLECLLTSPNGLVAFLEKSFTNAKHFAKVIEDAFELLRKTIEKHSPLLGKRMPTIVPIVIRCIQSSSVPARPRELAALVLQDSIAYGCLRSDSYEKLGQLSGELFSVFQQGKLPNRLQQNLYELMGQLAKHFPESVTAPDRMRDIFMSAAEKQLLEENYPSLVSLAGAIRGLDLFLAHFAPSERDRELRQRLYLMIKKLSIWDEGRSERVVFRNALQLLANHAALFTLHLYLDHVHWQTMLAGKWIKSTNQDDRLIGLNALYAFHGEIARVLSNPALTSAASEREYPPTVDVLNQYVGYYRKLLNSPNADHWEVRIAIRGFGIMAGPCQRVAGASVSLNELLTIVLQRIEGICERTASSTGDMLALLPDFIQALSEILTHAKQLTTVQLVSVQTMTVALVRDFYHLPTVHHELIVRSLVCMLENIGKLGGSTRDQLLDAILLQGIVWSCTHALPFGSSPPVPTPNDDPESKTDWKRDLVTYKNYLPLWQGLLNKARGASDSSLLRAIYRAFQNTLFVIVEKLDLSTRKRTFQDDDGQQRELFFCDPNIDLIPIKPKDYHIFLNLVELNRDVLHGPQTPAAVRELFTDWIRPYFERFVKQSLERPLVSGFVKLIEMGLGTAEAIGYFHQREDLAPEDPDVRSIQMVLVYYLEQTIQRALHAMGELQLACLRFVLKAPVRMLLDFVQDEDRQQPLMVEVFRTAFHIGRGLLSMARDALYSLQRIVRFRHPPLKRTQREQLLRQVLPMLDPFLRTRDSTQPPAQSLRLAKFKRHRTANVAAGKIERIKQQHRIERTADTSELVTFQMRILKFLSHLQPNECCWLVVDELEQTTDPPAAAGPGEFARSSLTRWDADSGRSLQLRLLCESGTRPCIKLDGMVGRVCQLAMECSDRATKLAACELLHTIVLYLLGIGYQDQLAGLWAQLCHHLLHLSCDTDLAVCQMFEPLLFQIIHFVTQPSRLSQQGTMALLDCLMDATSNVQHSAVRDLSIRCLREFLQWTNRQCGGAQSNNDRRKIKNTLLEQLKTHALESNASHRYGSALAFNNLFRLLLQEDLQIVRYTFELMHSYSIGLIVTEEQSGWASDGNGAIAEQFLLALDHLAKLLEMRKALFDGHRSEVNRSEQLQLVPPDIGGRELKHLVCWLFRQCATRQRLHRHKCMQLFPRLAKAVQGVAGGEQFLEQHFTSEQIKSICLQADSAQGIERAPTLLSLWDEPTNPSVVSIYLWLEYLLATIDMYCWLEREKLIGEDLSHVLLCRILPAVHCFLRSVVDCSVHEIMATITRTREIHLTSYEQRMNADKIVRFDALKSTVVAQIVDLLALLLSRTSEDNVPAECLALWQEQPVIDFILALLFKPHHQPGIDRNVAVMQDGQKNDHQRTAQLDALILQLMERCHSRVGQLFASALSEKLVAVMEDLGDRMKTLLTRRTIDTAYQKSAKGLLFIAKHQRNRGTPLMDDDKERVQQAARQLLTSCYEAIGQERVCLVLSPSAARFGTIVLEAVFSLSDAEDGLVDSIVAYCLSKDMLHPNICHGEYFLVCFGSAVYELFLTKPSQCLDTLLQALSADSFPSIVRILCDLMEYSYRRQAAGGKDRLEGLSEALLNGWSQLFTTSRLQPNHFGACDLQMIELMTNMMMICPFPLHKIRSKVGPNYGRWLTELIGSSRAEVTIELKTKAIVLLPTVLGPGDTPDTTESHWESFESALETLQTLHFPLRSTEFLPNSPKRVGFLNCLERLLEAMIVSRSPLLLKAIIHMTAPDGEGHIAESKIRNAIERFFDDQPYEMQCDRLQELWELFSNHAYAPTVRETILRRYLCTALWHCQYDTIVQFYKRIIRTISSYTTEDINGRSGWDLEHALVDLAASFRLIEHYAALLPKSVLTGESCPVAKELYGSPKDEGAPVRGQRLVGDFSKRAHSVRRVVLLSNDRSAVELFRKYQCAAYRALVALISNTNEDARMYSVLLFRETREKGEYLWRHLIDCSNDELYLEGSQEQEETPRTVAKRVAIRQEGVGPPFPRSFSKDPGLSVVRESSLSQQVFRFDLNHSVVLSARELAEKDAAELAKRQRGTLSSVSLERTKLNEHEAMATVCGCIRHMAASKVPLTAVVQFLAGSLADAGQPKNVRLFLAKLIDNCRKELQPHASLLLCPLMQLIVDGSTVRGLNPLVTDLIALVLEWNGSSEPKRQGAVDEAASLASVLLRFLVNHACQQQGARSTTAKALRLNLELIQELVSQWHDVLIVPAEVLYEMVSGSRQRLQSEERSQLQLIAGLQLGTIILTKGRGKLVPWMESTKQEYLRAVLRCLDLPDSTSFKSAALLLGHSLAHLYPEGLPLDDGDESVDELFHIECVAKLSAIQREYDRKFAEILYETAKGFPSIADPFLSVLSHRFPASAVAEKRMYLELLLGGRLETFKDDLYRELASMELVLLLRDNELQLPTLHLLNRSLPLVRETQHLQQLIEPIGSVTTEPATLPECRAVAYEILIYMHEHHFTKLSEECQHSVWRLLIRGLCGVQETDATHTATRARILEYLTDNGKLPGDVKERFLFLLADLYDPTVEAQFLGSAVALLLDPAIRCRESKDRLFLHEYLDADVKFNEYTIETAARQRHTMTLLTPMFADTPQQRQLQSFITGRGSQMEQLIRATQFAGMGRTTQPGENGPFEPTQDPTRFTKGHETFAMPTQQTLLFEPSSLQLDRRSQRTTGSMSEPTQQERTFDRLRKRILRDSEANRQKQTTWAVRRHYSNQRQRSEQRRDAASQVTLYRRYRLADYPDLQINLLAFLLPLQALCRRDTACARQTFVAIFNGLVECLVLGDAAGRTVRMVGDEWDRFVRRLDASLQRILETTSKASDPNLFGGLIELTLGRASGKFTLAPRTIASVAGASNMLTMGALYLEAKLTDAADFDEEPVRTGGRITSEAEHWLQLSSLYQAMHEHSVLEGIFAEKLDSDPQLREAIELEALGRYDRAHRAYCELVMRISQARVEERNFCYKSAFNCLLQLGQWDVLLDEIGNQVTSHEELWSDDWNLENLLPNYVHGNVLLVLAGNEAGREFYNMLQQWLHIPDRAKHIRQQFGEALTALYISGQEMVRARMFGEQTERQFLDEWHCAGVLSGLVRTDCLLSVRKVIELVAYSELLEECTTDRLEQATAGLIASWQNARPASTDSLTTWDTLIAYRRFLLVKLESKCGPQGSDDVGDTLGNVSKLSRLLYELELQLLDVAFEQNNIKYAGRLIASLRNSESCVGLRAPSVEHVLRRKIARIRFDRMRHVEGSSNQIQPLLRGFKQLAKINDQIAVVENEPDMARVKRTAWTEVYQLSESVRTIIKSTGEDLAEADSAHIQQMIGVVMKLPSEGRDVEGISLSERLGRLSTHCLQRSIDVLRPDSSSGSSALVELSEAHLRLARYCYEELSPERSEEEELPVERTLVSSLLPAIQYGSREARHLFPVLLQLRNLQNNTLRSEFHERSSLVPSWNFLPWIPQLLSYMKIVNDAVGSHEQSDERHFLDALLMRLVKEHPMALYHPARLMLAGIEGRPVRPIVLQFRAALNFPVLDRFVDELCRVVMPETRLQHMLTELKSQLNSFTDPVAFQTFIDRTVPDVFRTDSNDLWRFGQAYRAALPLVDSFRTLMLLHPVDDRSVILRKLQELDDALQSMRPRTKTKHMQLEDLSPWLADFHCSSMRARRGESSVEIPGQYGVDRDTPNPAQHATIVKVLPDVQVFVTLRQPIQITFRGSDGRQYRFLAKFGEDLRQDQRIQQLQREITHRLRWDRHCREHQLALRTYEVVPIRPNFGLFGWLEGTIALSDIAKQAAPRYNPGDRGQAHVLEEYGRFLLSVSRQDTAASNESFHTGSYNSPALYGMAAAFGMPDQLRSKYVELSQTIRACTLKRALYDMAASPESFYRLRMNFAKSLATMNMTCWALGIGDRHLSNVVLERATGMLVGVDFGIAFSAGTRDLPIPELVPFRLTPQFVGVMEPMRLAGLLQKCHLHTLQCLRDSRLLLRACLEVFVREPTVDWLRAARLRAADNADSPRASHGARAWNPQVRVNTVLRKLGGANPKQLLAEELRFGLIAQQREFLVGYLALVDASAAVSTEKVGREAVLSTAQQTEMLLEMAVDGKLLGITYGGWYPWF